MGCWPINSSVVSIVGVWLSIGHMALLTDPSARVVVAQRALVASHLTDHWGRFGFHRVTNLRFSVALSGLAMQLLYHRVPNCTPLCELRQEAI